MDPLEDPLDQALSRASWVGDRAQRRQERWEERVVKRILLVGLGASVASTVIRGMKNDAKDKTGEPALLFDHLLLRYPRFPIWLYCDPIPYAFQLTRKDFNGWPKKNKIVKAYLDGRQHIPDDWEGMPFGVVFEMMNQKSTPFYLAHDLFRPVEAEGYRESVTYKEGNSYKTVYIDNLDTFLQSVDWQPTAS